METKKDSGLQHMNEPDATDNFGVYLPYKTCLMNKLMILC